MKEIKSISNVDWSRNDITCITWEPEIEYPSRVLCGAQVKSVELWGRGKIDFLDDVKGAFWIQTLFVSLFRGIVGVDYSLFPVLKWPSQVTAVLFPAVQISTGIDRNGPSIQTQMGQEKCNYWKMIVMRLPVRFDHFLPRWKRGSFREREKDFVHRIDKQARESRSRILKMIERMPRANRINSTADHIDDYTCLCAWNFLYGKSRTIKLVDVNEFQILSLNYEA